MKIDTFFRKTMKTEAKLDVFDMHVILGQIVYELEFHQIS